MKLSNIIILLLLGTTGVFSQVTEIQASAENESQIVLRSFDATELFGLRLNNDGSLRFMANDNNNDEVMELHDDYETMGIGIKADDEVRIYSVFDTDTDLRAYGFYGLAEGANGTGTRYGVLGYARETTGIRYGVFGWANSFGPPHMGHWGVYCAGDFYYTGNFMAPSDRRLKSNIRSIDNALGQIIKLRPSIYSYVQEAGKGIPLAEGPQYGFVAQEMEKIIPDLVETKMHDIPTLPDQVTNEQLEIMSINYIGLIPILTKALQEQYEIIQKLENRISVLEKS